MEFNYNKYLKNNPLLKETSGYGNYTRPETMLEKDINENFESPEAAIDYLEKLALSGELDKSAIYIAHNRIIKAHNKMKAAKISPEKRAAAAQKGKNTKILNKIRDIAQEETMVKLGIKDEQGIDGSRNRFQLSTNMHNDKALQKKYNTIVNALITKYAKEAGISDGPELKSALSWHSYIRD